MADLYRCIDQRSVVKVVFSEQYLNIFTSSRHPDGCGKNWGSDVPTWLGRYEMLKFPVLEGTDLYLYKLGSVLYRVQAIQEEPYAEVKSESFINHSFTANKTDVSRYQGDDGILEIKVKDGSGYFMVEVSKNGASIRKQQIGLAPNPVDTLVLNNLGPADYYIRVIDELTREFEATNLTITAPAQTACPIEIIGLDITAQSGQKYGPNSAEKAGEDVPDGTVTVYATGAETLEYQLNEPGAARYIGWQSSNLFNVTSGSHRVSVRDPLDASCTAAVNFYVNSLEIIEFNQTALAASTCFNRANGQYGFSIGRRPVSYYRVAWQDGDTRLYRDDLRAGEHTITITAPDSGTSRTETIIIPSGPGPFSVEVSIESNDVYVSLPEDNPTAVYWYEWNDGVTSGSRQNLKRGEYKLKVGGYKQNGDKDKTCFTTYSLSIEGERHFFSDNPVRIARRALNPDIKPALSMLLSVFLEKDYLSDNFEPIGPATLEKPAAADGIAEFDISTILQSYLEEDIPLLSLVDIQRLDSQQKRFYVSSQEKYGYPPTIYSNGYRQYYYVLLGGLNKIEVASDDFFDKYLPEQRMFYTWQPVEKEVFVDQPEFLTYLVNEEGLPLFQVQIRLFFSDGSIQEDNLFSVDLPGRYELYRFPVGYEQLRLSDYERNSLIARYEITVSDGTFIPLSQTRSYVLNRSKPEYVSYLLYLNSLGGFDTLRATGHPRNRLKVSAETLQSAERYPGLTALGERTLGVEGQAEINTSAGFLGSDAVALQDFALSRKVLLLRSGRLLQVTIEMNTTVFEDAYDPAVPVDFTIQLPRDQKYTPDLAANQALFSTEVLQVLLESKQQATDENSYDGSIAIKVLNGQAPYSFLWNNGETIQNLENLAPGTYSVAVKDSSAPVRYGRLASIVIANRKEENTSPPVAGQGGLIDPAAEFSLYGTQSFEDFTNDLYKQLYIDETNDPSYRVLAGIADLGGGQGGRGKVLQLIGRAEGPPGISDYLPYPLDGGGVNCVFYENTKCRISLWIAISTYYPFRTYTDPGFDYNRLSIGLMEPIQGLIFTVNATANPKIDLEWQYVEVIAEVNMTGSTDRWPDDGRTIRFTIGFPEKPGGRNRVLSVRTKNSFYYIDDFLMEKLSR